MKTLFFTLFVLIILAVTFSTYFSETKKVSKNKIYKLVKIVLTSISATYLIVLSLVIAIKINFGFLFLFVAFCMGIFSVVLSVIQTIKRNDYSFIFFLLIGLPMFLGSSFALLSNDISTSDKVIYEKEILLEDCLKQPLKEGNKAILITFKYCDEELYVIQQYDAKTDVELPLSLNVVNNYELTDEKNTKIIVTSTQTTHFTLSSLFELSEPEVTEAINYELYLYFNQTIYCG